jgi:signal transduction histidine kinase
LAAVRSLANLMSRLISLEKAPEGDEATCHATARPSQPATTQEEVGALRAEVRRLRDREREATRVIEGLTEAVAARDAFITTAGHELRNPMGPILLGVTSTLFLARSAPDVPPWVPSRLETLERQVRGFVRRAGTLLEVCRLATGRLALEASHVCLSDMVVEVVRQMTPEADRARCELRVGAVPDVTGWWDSVALEQVTYNLLSNAIKYGAGRPVDILVSADEEFASLQVRDFGAGISESESLRIFERFEKASVQHTGPGFGLGLWVARQLIVAHGGELFVESEPGVGSVFTARLPRAIKQPQQ